MAFNGSGVFLINSAGQPVVSNTLITSAAFNALTADLATGLSNCITKDGQQTVTADIPMSGNKLTGLGLGTSSTDSASVENANILGMCEFRLTLTSGTPVTTTDVTAAETLYMTPYKGNRIALYDGTNWVMRTSAEMSIDIPDVTNMHDVFCFDNSGTPTLEVLVWTSATARATALTTQNGVLVKSGDLTRRYIGSFFCTTAGNGQTEDSLAFRWVWNYYNRVIRRMKVVISSNSYNYTTATVRQADGNVNNALNLIVGVSEDIVTAEVNGTVVNTSVGVLVQIGIGLDNTNLNSSDTAIIGGNTTMVANRAQYIGAAYKGYPGIGKHALTWVEYSDATGTSTWNNSPANWIQGVLLG